MENFWQGGEGDSKVSGEYNTAEKGKGLSFIR